MTCSPAYVVWRWLELFGRALVFPGDFGGVTCSGHGADGVIGLALLSTLIDAHASGGYRAALGHAWRVSSPRQRWPRSVPLRRVAETLPPQRGPCRVGLLHTSSDGCPWLQLASVFAARPSSGRSVLPAPMARHRHVILVCNKESVMSRRLWCRDSYGRWHEDHHAWGRSVTPAKWAVIILMMLAGLVVIASMIH
jgi:hypothetical protein